MRLTKEKLEEVKKKYNVDRLYSWSKINTFVTSPYEYYLLYILHKKPDIDNCVYAPMGSICHSVIEDFYLNKISYEEMYNNFLDGWFTSIDICDLKFDRNDETKNNNIKFKYKNNLEHFFTHHQILKNKVELERFLSAKIGNYVLQGYADAITKDDDDNFVIIDWKTSTKYSGKMLEEKSGQLTVYAIALNQLGVPFNKIKCCFNFLKYCTIQFEQKNGTIKTRDIERFKIGESLQSNAKMWLNHYGYDTDSYLKLLSDTNDIDCLPDKVRKKYKISDCYIYIPITQKLIDKWQHDIIVTIKDIEYREKDYFETHNDKIFWDNEEQIKKELYYHATLSGYSPNLHLPYKLYLENIENQKNSNIFGNSVDSMNNEIEVNSNKYIDLSWLDNV